MKKIQYTFTWNGKYYGKQEKKTNNGRITKYFVSGDDLFTTPEEITAEQYTETAERYSKIFG